MRKKILVTVMALILSAAMLAGCGNSSKDDDRSSRNRRERSYEEVDEDDEDDDTNGGWFSKWNDSASTGNNLDSPDDNDDINDDEDIASSGGFASSSDNNTQTDGSNVPASGSNNAAGSSAPSNGSNTSTDDYINDLKEFLKMSESETLEDDDIDAMIKSLRDLVNNLNVKTPEGLAIKTDMQDTVDILNEMMLLFYTDKWDDESYITDLENRMDKILESVEEHMDAFENAAIAAGVDVDSLTELDDFWGL